ncbi:MAG: Heat-inducible transcription repressor HrcA [Firmicutes bacterium]|nr:Heat-inducible transcription repressor HrcA [candidate division NPL-UPA2 bacterium]MBT9154032.1 Heat-inducible transcription repressor HrcA [candidate division NPL-UPA2 bacterium]
MLDARKRQVLFAIVQDYIQTAEPIGSRTIAKRHSLGVSSATIRNEMADLEELGFLAQPHTSAGRIPSDRGYRFYVDAMEVLPVLTAVDAEIVKRQLGGILRGQQMMLDALARLVSSLTNYTSIVIGPQPHQARLKLMQVIPLDENRAVLMLVLDTGMVANEVITLPRGLTMYDLLAFCNYVNLNLAGTSLSKLKDMDFEAYAGHFHAGAQAVEQAMDSLIAGLSRSEGDRVVLGGATNIFNQPEFRDITKLRAIMRVLDEHELVLRLVTSAPSAGASVSIGAENAVEGLRDCSLITATYRLGGGQTGHISVLGPTRMEYARVIALLNYVTKLVSQA